MKIAVASGKGGTGKTSVAVNLALSMGKVQVLDCDVEEPNVHILLRPKNGETFPVELLVPKILEERCDYCGECSKFCQYNALFVVGETAMVLYSPGPMVSPSGNRTAKSWLSTLVRLAISQYSRFCEVWVASHR